MSASPAIRVERAYNPFTWSKRTRRNFGLGMLFLSPWLINFKDKPIEHNPHRTGVVVVPDEQGGLIYQVESSAVMGKDDEAVRGELLQIIEPISGEVTITKVEPVRDLSGRVLRYRVWVERK